MEMDDDGSRHGYWIIWIRYGSKTTKIKKET
jgi:hypothetical protein